MPHMTINTLSAAPEYLLNFSALGSAAPDFNNAYYNGQ
jgi:hypothetical protein